MLLPAFTKTHPGITVKFTPTAPPEYNSVVAARLASGSAGDLITCRPFDVSLDLYKKGHLEKLNGNPALNNFPDSAKVAWQTDDGKDTYCVPMASVIHGFFYNKKIFGELGLKPPATEAEFYADLDKVKASRQVRADVAGHRRPVGHQPGRLHRHRPQLLEGRGRPQGADRRQGQVHRPAVRRRVADDGQVAALPGQGLPGADLRRLADAVRLGKAAIFPAGSWDIAFFQKEAGLDFGAFAPPVRKAGDPCYISDHADIGMGINTASKNKADAKVFLDWIASKEFADLYTNKATASSRCPSSRSTCRTRWPSRWWAGARSASRRSA